MSHFDPHEWSLFLGLVAFMASLLVVPIIIHKRAEEWSQRTPLWKVALVVCLVLGVFLAVQWCFARLFGLPGDVVPYLSAAQVIYSAMTHANNALFNLAMLTLSYILANAASWLMITRWLNWDDARRSRATMPMASRSVAEAIATEGGKIVGVVKSALWFAITLGLVLGTVIALLAADQSAHVLGWVFGACAFVTLVRACREIAPALAKTRPPLNTNPHGDAHAATEDEALRLARGGSQRSAVHAQKFAD